MLHNLRFFSLPEELIEDIVNNGHAEAASHIPHRLMRGIDTDIPSVRRFPQVIYTRSEAEAEFIYEVTKALDDNRNLFRETHIPYSYDPKTVAQPRSVPLHPGAERYYKEAGFLL
jgi:TRAP-type uncharacterized transport system substrate-binding protein